MAKCSRWTMWTLYFVVFVDLFQIGFVFPLVPQLVEKFGKGATEVGLLGSISAVGEGIAAPFLGALADRIGRRPVMILAGAGGVISSVLIGFADSYYYLLAARLVQGICGGTAGVAAAYIADVTTPAERPGYMTFFQASLFFGLSIGPATGGFLYSLAGYKLACFSSAGICALNLLLVILFLKDAKDAIREHEGQQDPQTAAAAALLTRSADVDGRGDSQAAGAAAVPTEGADADGRKDSQAAGAAAVPTGSADADGAKDSKQAELAAAPAKGADGDDHSAVPAPQANAPRFPASAWYIFLATFLNGVGFMAFEALGVLYIQDEFYDGDVDAATLFWTKSQCVVGIVGLVVNLFLYNPIYACTGLYGSVLFGGIISVASFFCVGIPLNIAWFFTWGELLVFGENIMGTSVGVMVTIVVDPSMVGEAYGTMTFFANIARAFGPFFFGPVYEHASKTLPWTLNSFLKLAAVILCLSTTVNEAVLKQGAAEAPTEPQKDEELAKVGKSAMPAAAAMRKAIDLTSEHSFLSPGSEDIAQATHLLMNVARRRRGAPKA